mgnify:CR=1 FL=1
MSKVQNKVKEMSAFKGPHSAAPSAPVTTPKVPVREDPRPNPYNDPIVWPHKICPTQRRDAGV